MRTIRYKLELSEKDGYTISIPSGQSGRIELKTIEASHADSENTRIIFTDICAFVQPDGCTSPEVRKNYQKIFLEGEWNGWKIVELGIRPRHISVIVCQVGSQNVETFSIRPIEPETQLKFAVEAPALDGSIETYTVEMRLHDYKDQYGDFLSRIHYLVVDEPCGTGERRVVFENGPRFTNENNHQYEVLVFEWR